MEADITTAELKAAYRHGNLWMLGLTFDKAIAMQSVLRAMQADARRMRKKSEAQGGPVQASLMLCGLDNNEIARIRNEQIQQGRAT
jgi:hypothetical protein